MSALIRATFASTLYLLAASSVGATAVTDKASWTLSGPLRGKANLSCRAQAPATTAVKVSQLPTIITVPHWLVKLSFATNGSFTYWEIDSSSANAGKTPSIANGWTRYTGTWTQQGESVSLMLDAASSANLFKYFNGGTTASILTYTFNKQSYRWIGSLAATADGAGQLRLKQTTRLKITHFYKTSGAALPQNKCLTLWQYNKTLTSQ
jgi:hypothetical protein